MLKNILILLLTGVSFSSISGQDSLSNNAGIQLLECDYGPYPTLNSYVEPYYAYDFNKPIDGNRPDFFYAYNRHNEVNIHLGLIKASWEGGMARATAAIGAGSYMNANYSAEPGVLKNIQEMNAGIRLTKKHNLWLDMGVLGSHIGFESAVGKDCQTLTRSIMAENSPYFETGARLSFQSDDEKWMFAGLLLNGWQRIQRLAGNSLPSFGTQIQFTPNKNILLNSSSFIGTDSPDSVRLMRYFHDFYGVLHLNNKWDLTAGFDIGWQQKQPNSTEYNTWFCPVVILRYAASDTWAIAARAEWYRDKAGVMIGSRDPAGFNVKGISINIDYSILPNAVWRLEGRYLRSASDTFLKASNTFSSNNALIVSSLAVSL